MKKLFFLLTRARQPSLSCHSGWTRNEFMINCEITWSFYYELFKHSIKDLMNWAACYWFFSAHLFHTDDFLVAFFYTLLIFFYIVYFKISQAAVEEDLSERCLCSPFLTPVQKPDLSRVICSRRHRKRGLWALPYLWRRWTSLLCRTRRARWSALSSSVLSTSWSAQKNKKNKKKREAAMTFRHRRGMSYYSETGTFLAFLGALCAPLCETILRRSKPSKACI